MAKEKDLRLAISDMRDLIDTIDDTIVWNILMRMSVAHLIMKIKEGLGIEVVDPGREEEIISKVKKFIDDNYTGPDADIVELYKSIGGMTKEMIALGKKLYRGRR